MSDKKIPWLNEGLVGFFEYDINVYGYTLVAREKEHLQNEVTNLLMHQNYDRVTSYIRDNTPIEYFEEWTDEQRAEISFIELIEKRLNDDDYREEIKQMLIDTGILYPNDITIDEIGYNSPTYTQDDVDELRHFVESFPSVSQVELEDIYLRQNSENVPYLLHRETVQNAELSAQNYENNLEVSELLCQIYEEKLAIEEQLISNSEIIVDLYEKVNTIE